MEDATGAVPAFEVKVVVAVGCAVELRTQGGQPTNGAGSLPNHGLDGVPVAMASTGGEGVSDVGFEGIRFVPDCGEAALSPSRRARHDVPACQHHRVDAGCREVQRGREPRSTGTDDDDVAVVPPSGLREPELHVTRPHPGGRWPPCARRPRAPWRRDRRRRRPRRGPPGAREGACRG